MANVQPVIGRLAPGLFIEPPGLQHRRSGRIIQAPDRWVVPMFRQEGDSQEEDRR